MGRTKTRGHRLAGNNPRGVAAGSLSRRHALKALLRVHLMSHAPRRSSALALWECSPCTETQPTSLAPSLRCAALIHYNVYIYAMFNGSCSLYLPRARAQSQRCNPRARFFILGLYLSTWFKILRSLLTLYCYKLPSGIIAVMHFAAGEWNHSPLGIFSVVNKFTNIFFNKQTFIYNLMNLNFSIEFCCNVII